jgi:hypothetical protein
MTGIGYPEFIRILHTIGVSHDQNIVCAICTSRAHHIKISLLVTSIIPTITTRGRTPILTK